MTARFPRDSSAAECPTCGLLFRHLDRNEDGQPEIPDLKRCAQPGCNAWLCHAGCERLSFVCDGCARRFCGDHKVPLDGLEYCSSCALAILEAQEDELSATCTCRQTDVDLFDPRGCEAHDANSAWNVRFRSITAVELGNGTARTPARLSRSA